MQNNLVRTRSEIHDFYHQPQNVEHCFNKKSIHFKKLKPSAHVVLAAKNYRI
jgi:hypothetical protein